MDTEGYDTMYRHLRLFRLAQPLSKRYYVTSAIVKVRDNEPLTQIELDILSDFIIYCLALKKPTKN